MVEKAEKKSGGESDDTSSHSSAYILHPGTNIHFRKTPFFVSPIGHFDQSKLLRRMSTAVRLRTTRVRTKGVDRSIVALEPA